MMNIMYYYFSLFPMPLIILKNSGHIDFIKQNIKVRNKNMKCMFKANKEDT